MKMTDEFITSTDLDWFASFHNGYLAHFTSGGSNLIPEQVKRSFECYTLVYDYFCNLDKTGNFAIVAENLPHFDNDTKRRYYISSFINAASKGFFSYDINFNDGSYLLIAKPVTPLLLNKLPENIIDKLCKLPIDTQIGAKHITKIE